VKFGENPPPEIEPQARFVLIDRTQMMFCHLDIDTLIDEDHPARLFWGFLERVDLSDFVEGVKSREGTAGRPATDPRLLIAVWLYAYSRGIGSAREVSRQIDWEPGFRWLTAMGEVNHHTLSDFRVDHQQALERLFTRVLGLFDHEGWITLERVMQDGTKIRTQCAQNSFRKRESLERSLERARKHVREVSQSTDENPRRQRARERGAREREERIGQALEHWQQLKDTKQQDKKKYQPKVSRTEPEARTMKTGDGSLVPCYNVQVTTDASHGLIVDMAITSDVNDHHQLTPAMDRVEETFQRKPKQAVADGDFTTNRSVVEMAEREIDFYGSWTQAAKTDGSKNKQHPEFRKEAFTYDADEDRYRCPAGNFLIFSRRQAQENGTVQRIYRSPTEQCRACEFFAQCVTEKRKLGRVVTHKEVIVEVEQFQRKMETEAAKEIYRQRSQIAEFPFAWFKSFFGLRRFHVRGRTKAGTEALWASLTYNLMRYFELQKPKMIPAPA
jgi:transposase